MSLSLTVSRERYEAVPYRTHPMVVRPHHRVLARESGTLAFSLRGAIQ